MPGKFAVTAAIAFAAIFFSYLFTLYLRFDEFNTRVDELSDVRIGEERQEVLYRLQMPLTVGLRGKSGPYLYANDLPSDSSIEEFDQWYWENHWNWDEATKLEGSASVEVGFASGSNTVSSIRCWTSGAHLYRHPCITASSVGTPITNSDSWPGDEDTVLDHYGEPDRVAYSGSQNYRVKTLFYDRFGLIFDYVGGELITIEKREKDISFLEWIVGGQPSAFSD